MKRILGYGILAIFLSCGPQTSNTEYNPIVASVGNKKLYKDYLKDFFPDESISREDSLLIRNNVIDKWIRQTILLQEAEKYVKGQLDIDKLVNDYRESLLIHNYEERLVEERLDTVITEAQIQEVYEVNKDSYLLTSDITLAYYAIIPANTSEIKTFKKSWIRQDVEEMKMYCEKYQVMHSFETENWVTFASLKDKLPEELFSDATLKSEKSLDKEVDGIQYFVKVKEFRDKNKVAPLSYIRDKIEKVILYNRKVNLLKSIRKKLYERDFEAKKVKIYDI